MRLEKTRQEKLIAELKSQLNKGIKDSAVTSGDYVLVYKVGKLSK